MGHAIALLGDRWSMLIVREALAGTDRYLGFRRSLAISDHTLTRRLSHLQEIGVLERERGKNASYHLTPAGEDLARVLAVFGDWAMQWLPVQQPIRTPPALVIQAAEQLGFDVQTRLDQEGPDEAERG